MSQLIRDLHDKYILDFDPNSNNMVVYKYCPATFSKAEGEFIYNQCATFSYSPSTGGGSTQSGIAGSWYDTTSQTTTANTPTKMFCDTTSFENGITKKLGSNFEVSNAGRYNLQFSVQLDQSSGAGHHIFIWFRKNGVDIPYSASEVAIQGSLAESIPSWNFIFELEAGDYVNVMYSVTDSDVYLKAVAPGTIPGIPSVIITMWKL
jgi:hypothetical protein